MKHAWIDVRAVPADQLEAVVDAAIHAKAQAVVSADAGHPSYLLKGGRGWATGSANCSTPAKRPMRS